MHPNRPLILNLFLAIILFIPIKSEGQGSLSGIGRIIQQIEDQFPLTEGYVITLVDDELILDLKLGQPIKPGDRLQLIRYGEPLKHPVTGKDLGYLETDLGEVEILEVRKNFTRARLASGSIQAQKGDGVRSHFKKLSILLGPVSVQNSQSADTNALMASLEKELNAHSQFEAPSFDLRLWLLESGLKAQDLSKPETLKRLHKKIQADYILNPEIRSVKGKLVLAYELISTRDGSLVKQGQVLSVLSPKLAKTIPQTRYETDKFQEQDTQTSFEKKTQLVGYIGKQQFDYEIVDFDIGDINGDGKQEYVVASNNRLYIYNYENGQFNKIAQISRKKNVNRFISVDLGDINKNGRDEIFITNQYLDKLGSFVLELQDNKMKPLWENVNGYFRIIRSFNAKPILLYQSLGFVSPFAEKIKTIKYQNGNYRENPPLELRDRDFRRRQFILYGMTRGNIDSDKNIETIILDKDYHLRVYSANGALLVKSDEYYGHDPRPMRIGLKEKWVEMASEPFPKDPIYHRGRLLLEQYNNRRFLTVPKNHRLGGSLLARTVIVNNCSLVILKIGKEGFEKVFETRKQRGYLAAYQVAGESARRVIHLAAVSKGSFGQKTTSTIFTYNWDLQG